MKTEPYDIRVAHEPRSEENSTYWAYFSKNGYIQVRSIAPTKKQARLQISCTDGAEVTYLNYERNGYVCKKIKFTITPL